MEEEWNNIYKRSLRGSQIFPAAPELYDIIQLKISLKPLGKNNINLFVKSKFNEYIYILWYFYKYQQIMCLS